MAMVKFNYLIPVPELKNRQALKAFLQKMAIREKHRIVYLQVIFCDDEYLLEMNRQFLHHDFYTDIITFNLGDPGRNLDGELYISIDRVRENARMLQGKVSKELHRVIFHGLLHLCGYDDKLKKDQFMIRAKEDEYLKRYFG